jgi:hypothetical protein
MGENQKFQIGQKVKINSPHFLIEYVIGEDHGDGTYHIVQNVYDSFFFYSKISGDDLVLLYDGKITNKIIEEDNLY